MYKLGINKGIQDGFRNEVIARKIFLTYPTFVFLDDHEMEFKILNPISTFFKIPITSVQVVGSSKTGFSFFQNCNFIKGESDLDIAIIDPILFQKYCELVMRETDGYRDLSKFSLNENTGQSNFDQYKQYITKGIFRPDLMPVCEEKKKWKNFFNRLSGDFIDLFSDINAGIYFSQVFFEYRKANDIEIFKNH
jgi:hypothetical protein